jgi:prepilin-type N-terminal cleavage/methylation domain-containing protein
MKMGGHQNLGQLTTVRRFTRRPVAAPKQSGFTVIEVLIVLAVTAFIFVMAAWQISGRQNRTAFEVAIREVHSQIQKVVNEVSSGFYPSFNNISCLGTPTGPSITLAAGSEQGVNQDCIAMGKVIQFRVAGTDPEQFRVYTIAGLRLNPDDNTESDSPADARPKVIAPSSSNPNVPDNSVRETLQSGTTTHSVVWGAGAGTAVGAIAFSQSMGSFGSSGVLQSGAHRVEVAAVDTTTLNMTSQVAAEAINSNWASSTFNPADGIRICFNSGTTDQSGLVTIGSKGRDLSVSLDVRSSPCT